MTETPDRKKNKKRPSIQLALPAKITGIVFWGMVLVGLLVVFYLLDSRENNLILQYESQALVVAYNVEKVIEEKHPSEKENNELKKVFFKANEKYGIEALSFFHQGRHYNYGVPSDNPEIIKKNLKFNNKTIELSIFVENLQQSIAILRKKMILVIGSLAFLFGLVLQQILHKVLSKPFLNMVNTAEQFAEGENSVRFDENRSDEFGYMAKFINRALNSLLKHQSELEESKKALFEEKVQAEVTLQSILDGVITTSADARVQYMNPVAERLTGWTNSQAKNVSINNVVKIIDEETALPLINPVEKCLHEDVVEHRKGQACLLRDDGETVSIEMSAAPMKGDGGEIIGAVVVIQDVSHSRRLTQQLSYQASHDALTGLYNRRMFEELLLTAILDVPAKDRSHVMYYIDLDQFKIVNDTCGHMAGDELLRQMSTLIQGCIRDNDKLARLGGDEFGVLLESCPHSMTSEVAEKIRIKVKGFRFSWQDNLFEIGASIGVVSIDGSQDLVSIMSAADVACYAAKDSGRNRVHVYEATDDILAERHGQMLWASRIVEAIEQNRFVLFQQPEVALIDDGSPAHLEILIRMIDSDGHLVMPDSFIPAAERYNLMAKVDRWVINHVFESLGHHRAIGDGSKDQVIAINLSGLTLVDDDLYDFVIEKQTKYGVDLSRICFEVTETAAISNLAKATQLMNRLKKQGCQFALDDFGSGLSSFGYLKHLPVDYIKIDGSFVVDMVNDPIDRSMVEAITRIAHVMKIKTIAEWVENEATLTMLQEMGVDYAQGYYIGKPSEIAAINM